MGRSNNSFKSFVGQIEVGFHNDSPEKRLFVAVLSQAAHDCFSTHVERHDKEQARHFFMTDHFHFNLICELADRNPLYVKDKMRNKIILNIDMPIHNSKEYRSDQKKYKRKPHLTGNAYYAAKRKREEEHV